jgi:uncharacterized protein YbaP (TraB family)
MKNIYPLLLILSITINVQAQENALLWQVTGKDLKQPSFLFGTIHMICPEDFSISDSIRSTFNRTGKLYLEIDMDDASLMIKTVQLSMLKQGSIQDLMNSESYTRLERFMKDTIGMPMIMVNKMKPFTLLSLLYSKILPCRKPESYEQRLLEMAKKQNMEVLGLEKLEDQFAVFDKIPDTTEISMIMEMIDNYEIQRTEFAKMVLLYNHKDLNGLANMINASPDMAGFEDILLINRNRNWIPVMEKAMAAQPTFFAVGAGHLPGENGVIGLLKKSGYTITPVD